MKQPIIGYHLDEDGHWVAELRCGHGQHVRHDPPWQVRPWVTTAEGRASFLGVQLECVLCDDMRTIQPGANVGNFFTAVKRGVQAMGEAPTGERYTVAGKVVTCGHCARDRFVEGRAQLNTAGMTFLNLDWANRSAATLTCTTCGRIEWFLTDPEEA